MTRYRDIPFSEARKCQRLGNIAGARNGWNKFMRGKPVEIETPGFIIRSPHVLCEGPFYRVVNVTESATDDVQNIACPHIAEIGD